MLIVREIITDDLDQPPHNFSLIYNPNSVSERNTYSLQVSILDANERLLFVNDTAYDVITRGNPRRVDVELVPTEFVSQNPSDNNQEATGEPTTAPGTAEAIESNPDNSSQTATVAVSGGPTDSPAPGGMASSGALWIVGIALLAIALIAMVFSNRHKVGNVGDNKDLDESE